MAVRRASMFRGAFSEKYCRVMIAATTVLGALYLRHTGTNVGGEVVVATTTGATDFFGIAAEAVTYSTTQTDFDGFVADLEGTCGMICDPYQIVEMLVSGGATAGTALNSTAPANILTNTSADTTGLTVTATEVGTASMAGGILVGRRGNNAGLVRRISAHTNSTSCAVTVPFPRTLAANDTFYRFPWSLAAQTVQFTSDITQADGTIATGTGAPFSPVQLEGMLGGVTVDIANDVALLHCVARSHQYHH